MPKQLKQYLAYLPYIIRLIAKIVGSLFALLGVFIFVRQFLPTYIHHLLWTFWVAWGFWALDTVWSAFEDVGKICDDINKQLQS
jgi:hypothetical protein